MESPRLLLLIRDLSALLVRLERALWSPRLYGEYASLFRVMFRASLPISTVAFAVSLVATNSFPAALMVTVLTIASPFIASRLFRAHIGFALERDMPIIMSLLLPLARVSSNLADIILYVDRERLPFSLRFEISRLRVLMNLGLDPVAALQALASTTPSKSFSYFLRDYVNSVIVGASRTDIAVMFLREALQKTRDQWRVFFAASYVVSEIVATVVVSMPVLVPLMLLGGVDWSIAVLLLALTSLAAGFTLMFFRPRVGSVERTELLGFISVLLIASCSIVGLRAGLLLELALLTLIAIAIELYALRESISVERASSLLREALEEARVGILNWDKLARVRETILTSVIDALLASSTTAGSTRAQEVLAYIHELHEEVRRSSAESRRHSLVLATLMTLSLAITLYFLKLLATILEQSGAAVGVDASSLINVAETLVAMTPTLLLPPAIVYREWLPSPLLPLMATLLLYALLALIL
ncbi:MAG: hypothetical protein QXS85_03250 [Acidilobaceae archaeon]